MTTFTTYPELYSINFSNDSLTKLWTYGNTVTHSLASPTFIVVSGLTMFAATGGLNFKERGFTAAAYIMFIESFLMLAAGVLDPIWFFTMMVLCLVAFYIGGRFHG